MTNPRPAVAAYLAEAAAGATAPSGTTASELRAHWDAFVLRTHALVRDLPGACDVEDVVLADGTRVRVYRPAEVTGPADRVHVHLHGGGWWMGSIATVEPMSRNLALGLGMPVISVDYPLAPERPWPAALDAVLGVLAWAGERWASISLGGESAGANLAAAAAIAVRDTAGPRIAALWLDVPVVDLSLPEDESLAAYGSGLGIEVAQIAQIVGWYLGTHPVDDPLVSPAHADLDGLPPTLLTVAELDPFRDQGLRFADQLTSAGVVVDTRVAEGHVHGSSWLTALDEYTERWHADVVAGLAACHQRELTR